MAENIAKGAGTGAAEFGIFRQMQPANDRPNEIIRIDDLDLAIDEAGVDQVAVGPIVLVQNLGLAGIHHDAGVGRIHGMRRSQIGEHQGQRSSDRNNDDRPLTTKHVGDPLEAQDSPAEFDAEFVSRPELLSRLIHLSTTALNDH